LTRDRASATLEDPVHAAERAYPWLQSVPRPGGLYRARSPRSTPLYRLFEAHFDEVKAQWAERFERRYGYWRGLVDEQVWRYLDCGLFEHGFARVRCPDCAQEYLLAFSCKTRDLCPSCAAKRSAATAALLADEVFQPVGHAQYSQALERLTRYILRSPVSLERMRWNGVGDVRYRRKSGHDSASPFAVAEETFDPLDFLARVIMHIPAPRRHLVRYYGAYSNAARGRRRRASEIGSRDELHATETGASDLDAKTLRRRWATLIKRVYQVDPLICPACGAEMRIIAFIVNPGVVDAILRHISPPSAHQPSRAPPQGERLATVS
jgi:hypothetical protein